MLNEKVFLVTGGSRGIGRAIVLELAQAGAHIAFTYHSNKEAADEVVLATQAHQRQILAIQANVADYEQARFVVEAVRAQLGDLDGIVLNAGITRDQVLATMPEEKWDEVIATNLKGIFNYARASMYGMLRQRSGRVVCVSSVSGSVTGVMGQTNYAATKAAQIGFVKSLAKEVAAYGITVNAVAPGFIETDIWHAIPEAKRESLLKTIPQRRLGQPGEVAAAVRFLLSPEAAYINGSVLVIDGGLSA